MSRPPSAPTAQSCCRECGSEVGWEHTKTCSRRKETTRPNVQPSDCTASAPPAEPEDCRCFEHCEDDDAGVERGAGCLKREPGPAPQDTTDGVAEALQRRLDAASGKDWGACEQVALDAIAEVRRLRGVEQHRDEMLAEQSKHSMDVLVPLDEYDRQQAELARLRAAAPPDKKNRTGQGRGGS